MSARIESVKSWIEIVLLGGVVIAVAIFAWGTTFNSDSWITDGILARKRMSRDVVENVIYLGMPEEDVCRLLGPDSHGHCADDPHAPKNSHWRIGLTHRTIVPWITDEQNLTIIYDSDRRVSKWMLLHPPPSLGSPSSWYLPF